MDKWKPNWIDFFDQLGIYFNKHLGPNWKERDKFFLEVKESLMKINKTS